MLMLTSYTRGRHGVGPLIVIFVTIVCRPTQMVIHQMIRITWNPRKKWTWKNELYRHNKRWIYFNTATDTLWMFNSLFYGLFISSCLTLSIIACGLSSLEAIEHTRSGCVTRNHSRSIFTSAPCIWLVYLHHSETVWATSVPCRMFNIYSETAPPCDGRLKCAIWIFLLAVDISSCIFNYRVIRLLTTKQKMMMMMMIITMMMMMMMEH